jgi:two-component system, LuxR family, response regulator FixJ
MVGAQMSLLVVDDDAAVRNSLKFSLELEGFNVRVSDGAQEVLAASELDDVDCLIVDQYMPRMTGIELVKRLRRRNNHMPAILITARMDSDLKRRAAAVGISRVLEKPLSGGALLDGIRLELTASRGVETIAGIRNTP